ncbi:MAG: DUF4878 domain-containing protein [Ignavibacteriaceae bacterium]|nr:DUF4878 domain-containing protein [Ignavibacteriaceae bacterium]
MKHFFSFILLAIFALAFIQCGSSSGPGDTMKEFFGAVEKNDVGAVSDLLAPEVKAMLGDKKLEKVIAEKSEEITEKGGIANIEITEEKIEEDTANIKFKITYGNGDKKEEKGKLMKIDGTWKVGVSK